MDAKHQTVEFEIGPQPGPQTDFLETSADIAIYGGAAGGGKSFSLLIDPLRHYMNKDFSGVIFRRTTPAITNPGALWDEATTLYSKLGATSNETELYFIFQSGMSIKFAHMEHEKDLYSWQGAAIPFIGFDELTQFTEKQFFGMVARNRSTTGIRAYIRGTCNPDVDSWVRKFIDWWIGEDGLPIKERAGKLRYFIRSHNELIWADTREELIEKYGEDQEPKSVTFIPAKLEDNQIFVKKDPTYRSNLKALPYVERMRLEGGNWNIRPAAGLLFKREWFEVIDALPPVAKTIRYWDRASSKKKGSAWTVGLKMHITKDNQIIVSDIVRFQGRPLEVRTRIQNVATQDGLDVIVGIERDPGQAGDVESEDYTRLLIGHIVKLNTAREDKVKRAEPFSAHCEQGNVKVLRRSWNDVYFDELESFPDISLKDQVDSSSGAFKLLVHGLGSEYDEKLVAKKGNTIAKKQEW